MSPRNVYGRRPAAMSPLLYPGNGINRIQYHTPLDADLTISQLREDKITLQRDNVRWERDYADLQTQLRYATQPKKDLEEAKKSLVAMEKNYQAQKSLTADAEKKYQTQKARTADAEKKYQSEQTRTATAEMANTMLKADIANTDRNTRQLQADLKKKNEELEKANKKIREDSTYFKSYVRTIFSILRTQFPDTRSKVNAMEEKFEEDWRRNSRN